MPESVVTATTSENSVSTTSTGVLALTTTNDPYTGPFKLDFFLYTRALAKKYIFCLDGSFHTNSGPFGSLPQLYSGVVTTGGAVTAGGGAATGGGAFAVSGLR